MSTIHVVVGYDDKGDENVHEFEGETVTWMPDPSGVVNVFKAPNRLWASYAPGSWKVVRSADRVEQDWPVRRAPR